MNDYLQDIKRDIQQVLISENELISRIKELSEEITSDYCGKEIVMVGILNGAVMFFSELAKNIDLNVVFDFMAVSSYGASAVSSGVVRTLKDLDRDIKGMHVIIVEDIVDTGLTLDYLVNALKMREPASIKICAMLDKPDRHKVNINIDYLGFTIPDEFLVGFGLDYAQKYRNLPYIAMLKREAYS